MDAIVVIGLLLALVAASSLWACDSREGFSSEEQSLARRGVTWSEVVAPRVLPSVQDKRQRVRRLPVLEAPRSAPTPN